MNTQASTGFHSAPPSSPTEETQPGHTARFLRILGALAIGGSGLLYMLQGLYNTDTDLRSWVYLALMTALGAGGIFSLRLMQDSKGARLFFALAALLIPVQFSQLGAMTLSLFTGTSTTLEWYAVSAPATSSFLLIGALSMAMAIALSFAAFSVLARNAAKPLSFLFIVMNTLLLLPFRDSFAALPLLAALFALTLFLEMRIFRREIIFQTLEGAGVRLMMLLPITIAVCRNAFHFSDSLGISAILAASGFILHYLAVCQVRSLSSRYVREIFWLLSFICLLPASLVAAHELFDHSNGLLLPLDHHWYSVVYTLPVLACTLHFSTRSHLLSMLYQFAACAALCVGIAWVLDANHAAAEFALWCAAIITLCQGMVRRQKIVFIAGVLTSIGLGGHLLYTATRDIHINLWLMLALGGLILMVLSSVCEKHGRKWLHNSREYWREFSEWETR